MSENKIRGLVDGDDKAFDPAQLSRLKTAQEELHFLLCRGYPLKSAMTFVGNHHQLTVRQALAVARSTASPNSLERRKKRQLAPEAVKGQTVHIDGFNLIITLEVALSGGVLFAGQDGCVRDLAELRGTYRLIPQTGKAIELIRDALSRLEAGGVVFYLDQPVSNSGRLKQKIQEIDWPMPLAVDIVRSPDTLLKKLPCVVTGDSVILDECESWFNMTAYILEQYDLAGHLTRFFGLNSSGTNI